MLKKDRQLQSRAQFVPHPPAADINSSTNNTSSTGRPGALKRQTTDLVARSRASRQTGANQPAAARAHQLEQLQTRLRGYRHFSNTKFSKGMSPSVGPDAILAAIADTQTAERNQRKKGRRGQSPNNNNQQQQDPLLRAIDAKRGRGGPGDHHRVVNDPIYEDGVFRIWLAENPFASKEEIETEIRRRNVEKLQAERAQRLRYVREYQSELTELSRQQELSELLAHEEEKQRQMEERKAREAAAAAAPKPPPRVVKPADFDLQRSAWDMFVHSNQELPAKPKSPEPAFVEDVHDWVESEGWKNHTDRHENAALKIQCCFRKMLAKRRMQFARIKRQRVLKAVLQSEESAQLAWEMARITSEKEQLSQAAVDSRFRAIEFWKRQMRAKIEHRRRAHRRATEAKNEVENYAATRIQAVWRGGSTRQRLREELDPTIVERREAMIQREAATAIQRIVRGVLTRSWITNMKASSFKIQQCFRNFMAYGELHRRKKKAFAKEVAIQRDCAAKILQKFFTRTMKRKWRAFEKHSDDIITIQKAGRGFLSRRRGEMRSVFVEKRLNPAAVSIQCLARKTSARRRVQAKKQARDEAEYSEVRQRAATVVTNSMRRGIAVKKVKNIKAERQAALDIQRVYRGHLGRCRARAVKDRRVDSADGHRTGDSATMIQALWRGYSVRKEGGLERKLEEKRQRDAAEASSNPTNLSASETERSRNKDEKEIQEIYYGTGDDAAHVIRRFYYAWIRWPKLRSKINTSAQKLSNFMRRVPVLLEAKRQRIRDEEQRAHQREDAAATVIQLAWKASTARTRVGEARSERVRQYHSLQANEAADVLIRVFRGLSSRRKMHRLALQRQEKQLFEDQQLVDALPALPSIEEDEANYQRELAEKEEARLAEIRRREQAYQEKLQQERDQLEEKESEARKFVRAYEEEGRDQLASDELAEGVADKAIVEAEEEDAKEDDEEEEEEEPQEGHEERDNADHVLTPQESFISPKAPVPDQDEENGQKKQLEGEGKDVNDDGDDDDEEEEEEEADKDAAHEEDNDNPDRVIGECEECKGPILASEDHMVSTIDDGEGTEFTIYLHEGKCEKLYCLSRPTSATSTVRASSRQSHSLMSRPPSGSVHNNSRGGSTPRDILTPSDDAAANNKQQRPSSSKRQSRGSSSELVPMEEGSSAREAPTHQEGRPPRPESSKAPEDRPTTATSQALSSATPQENNSLNTTQVYDSDFKRPSSAKSAPTEAPPAMMEEEEEDELASPQGLSGEPLEKLVTAEDEDRVDIDLEEGEDYSDLLKDEDDARKKIPPSTVVPQSSSKPADTEGTTNPSKDEGSLEQQEPQPSGMFDADFRRPTSAKKASATEAPVQIIEEEDEENEVPVAGGGDVDFKRPASAKSAPSDSAPPAMMEEEEEDEETKPQVQEDFRRPASAKQQTTSISTAPVEMNEEEIEVTGAEEFKRPTSAKKPPVSSEPAMMEENDDVDNNEYDEDDDEFEH